MNRKKIIALLLCAFLAFSGGCSLIDIDQEKADAIDNAKVLAEYNDIDITKEDVVNYFTQQGYAVEDLESEDTWDSYLDNALDQLIIDEIAMDKAAELELDQLTEDEAAKVDEDYNSGLDSIASYSEYLANAAVEEDASLNYDEEYQKTVDNYYEILGTTEETYRAKIERYAIFNKVYDYYIKDITVTDDEVKDYYDTQVTLQQGNIDIDPSMVEMTANFGGRILVYPEGYMNVRHIFLSFDDDMKNVAAAAYGEDNTDEYNSLIAEAEATLQTSIDDIESRLAAGEDFGTLMDEYNEDTTYTSDPNKTEGTETGPYKTEDIPGYLDAVATLTEEGQVSDPLVNYNGVYFIQCVKMLAGVVPYEDVQEDMTSEMLSSKQSSEWSTVTQDWIDTAEADGTLKIYPERY